MDTVQSTAPQTPPRPVAPTDTLSPTAEIRRVAWTEFSGYRFSLRFCFGFLNFIPRFSYLIPFFSRLAMSATGCLPNIVIGTFILNSSFQWLFPVPQYNFLRHRFFFCPAVAALSGWCCLNMFTPVFWGVSIFPSEGIPIPVRRRFPSLHISIARRRISWSSNGNFTDGFANHCIYQYLNE